MTTTQFFFFFVFGLTGALGSIYLVSFQIVPCFIIISEVLYCNLKKIQYTRLISGILTLHRVAQRKKIEKPNNLKVFVNKTSIKHKEDRQSRLRLFTPEVKQKLKTYVVVELILLYSFVPFLLAIALSCRFPSLNCGMLIVIFISIFMNGMIKW